MSMRRLVGILALVWGIGFTLAATCNAQMIQWPSSGPYNVMTFGAVLDGVTDDAAAIQRAVNQGGKIVFPPNSTAYISVPIQVPSNTVIDCRNSTIKTVSGGSIFRAIGSASNPLVGVEIENCNLDGKASTLGTGNSSSVIYLDYVNGFSIQHDTVRDCGWWCAEADFSNSGLIADNYFTNTYGDCAGWEQGANVKLVNNTCDGFSDGGFSANVNASNGVIAGNVLENGRANSFGIEAAGANNVTISSNIVESGYGQNGIRLLANNGFDTYAVTVANNTVGNAASGQFCINLTTPNQASHPNSPLIITNNFLNCGSGDGIYIWADDTTASGNTIVTSATGIVLDGNSTTTSNNLFINRNVIIGAANAVTSAPGTVVVNALIVGTEPVVATTLTGTSGTATCSGSMSSTSTQNVPKAVTCYLNGYAETGTAQTYTFPTAFLTTPVLLESGGSCGTYNPTATATTLTLPANASMTAETCNVVAIGQ